MEGITLERLQVIIEAYTKPYRDELDKVKKQTSSVTSQVERQTQKMRNSFRRVGAAVASVLGTGAIIAFGKSCIDLGSDLQEVQNVVDVTFGSMNKQVDAFAKNAITQFGLSELTAKKYMGTYGAMAKSFGIVGEAGYQMSAAITGLTGDVASFYNLSTDEAYTKLKSIFTGETESLKELGVVMTQTALDQYALNEGLGKTTRTMTEQEKVLLRYRYVMSTLSDASGDFARTSGSWANQTRILALQFDSLRASIGQGLINVFTPVIHVINTVLAKMQTLAAYFRAFTAAVFGDANGGSSGVADSMESAAGSSGAMADNMGAAASSARDMKKSLAAFDEINNLTSSQNGNGGSGAAGGNAEIDFGNVNWNDETLVEEFKKKFNSLYEIGEYIGDVLESSMDRIDWESIYRKADNFGTGLADFLNGLISPGLFSATGRTIAGALNTAIYAALSFGGEFDWTDLGLSIASGINGFFETFDFTAAGQTVNTFANGLLDMAISGVENTNWFSVGQKIGDFLGELDWGKILAKTGKLIVEGIISGIVVSLGSASRAPLETVLLLLLVSSIKSLNPFVIAKELIKKISEGLLIKNLPLTIQGITFSFSNLAASSIILAACNPEAFSVIAWEVFSVLSEAIEALIPDWAFDFLSHLGAGISLGAVAGSWFPGAGTVAGAIVGGILGALAGIKIDGKSVLKTIGDKIFNFDMTKFFFEEAKKSFETAFDADSFGEIGLNIVMGILEGIAGAITFVAEPFVDLFEWIYNGICDVFGIASPAKEMEPLGEYILLGIIEGFRGTFEDWTKSLDEWFNDHIAPWFTVKKWSELYETMKSQMKEKWDETVKQWDSDISTWWEEHVLSWFSKEKWTSGLSGVKDGFEGAFSAAFDAVKQLWNRFANWLNEKLNFDIDPIEIGGIRVFDGAEINLGKIPTFASGGFPAAGQLFVARERGPELVGQIGSRTAVANNEQIVDAVARGVYMALNGSGTDEDALYRAFRRALADESIHAVLDSERTFKRMQKLAKEYKNRTGVPAFG